MSWLATGGDSDGEFHVVPLEDVIQHEVSDECLCGPASDPVPRDDGSVGWVVTHHSADGREFHE